jgi:predicted nucleotidyltransferase
MDATETPVSAQAWCELHQWGITEERVSEAVRRIVTTCSPERVVAFGSWARGEAKPESDLDLAVIVDDASDVRESASSFRP